jgi:CRISPR-associated exonuclease Cas4
LRLGISGQADVVEFHALEPGDGAGAVLKDRAGRWRPCPVEYKRGKPKRKICDLVQVCAQALCLEEMLGAAVPEAALFYATPRRRHAVPVSPQLRAQTEALCLRMHELYRVRQTPAPVYTPACESCSLKTVCCPKVLDRRKDVRAYLARAMED